MTEENLKVAVRVRPFISLRATAGCVDGGPRVMVRRVGQTDRTQTCVYVSPWMLTVLVIWITQDVLMPADVD